MPSYLLDTSVILDLINDRNDRRNFIRSLAQPGDTLGCCLINVVEVYSGMRPGEEAITRHYLDRLLYYDITREIGQDAGRLRYQWQHKGRSISLADATLAAVALAYRLILLTDNRKHFPMPELKLPTLP